MEFIYKIRHIKTGLYLDDRNLLSEDGIIYKKIPTFSLDKRLADGTETKYSDWEFVQFVVIIHETIETKPYNWVDDGGTLAMDKADMLKALKTAFDGIKNTVPQPDKITINQTELDCIRISTQMQGFVK